MSAAYTSDRLMTTSTSQSPWRSAATRQAAGSGTSASVTTSSASPTAGAVTQSTPTGLTMPARRSAGDQLPYGVSIHATLVSATASTASPSAGRQRLDGRRPSGSTSGT